jgi:glycosyltransferase involved in cell wall biosynthesis
MSRPLVIDMSRLWLASLRPTPRGIERVDFALARQLTEEWTGPLQGLSWTPWGIRLFDRHGLARLLAHIETIWREQGAAADDPVFRHVRDWLLGRADFEPEPTVWRLRHHLRRAKRAARTLRATGISAGTAASAIPQGAILASFGHVGLLAPGMRKLVAARPDIKMAALIHDIVSITDPHFFRDKNEDYFREVLSRAMGRGNLILTTTDHVRQQIEAIRPAAADGEGPRITTVDIGHTFRDVPAPAADRELADAAYFLICGTREPRKNHLLLLNVWRELAHGGQRIPKLVMAGGHGWGAELVDVTLARSDTLRGHIAHVESLSSPGLFHLVGQARALLAPSFEEGYGLPVAEALSMGTPVVASKIPVFAETTRDCAVLIDPLDGLAWQAEIQRRAAAPAPTNPEKLALAALFRQRAAKRPSITACLQDA